MKKPKINLEQNFWAKGSFTAQASLNIARYAQVNSELEIFLVNNNQFDPNAISLRIRNQHIGWVPMTKSRNFRLMFKEGYGAKAIIDRISKDGDMVHVNWLFSRDYPIGKQYEKPVSWWQKVLRFFGF